MLAAGFLPAAWASVAATRRRERILKATVIGCLGVAVAGVLFFGVGFALLMMVPTTLIAIAGGLVLQGRSRR